MAALKAGAAHPRRQKRREMPPPGASAPAFAATVEPARARPHAKHPRQDACFGARWNACRGMCCFMHRFFISRPDLRIDVSFSPKTSFCVHRFLISSPNLGIDASFSPFTPSCVHRFLISGSDLGIDVSFSPFTPSFMHRFLISGLDLRIDARGEWFCLQQLLRQRCFASDSILRSRKEEWFRLQRLSRQRGPCPILIFVAAKKNGPPAAAVAATIFRGRF